MVVASKNKELCEKIQEEFMSENLRIYTCEDVRGVELGGALKNIIAFCAGVAAGLGLGDNSFAALITRGLKEISELRNSSRRRKRDILWINRTWRPYSNMLESA